jgi:hypothetical protein
MFHFSGKIQKYLLCTPKNCVQSNKNQQNLSRSQLAKTHSHCINETLKHNNCYRLLLLICAAVLAGWLRLLWRQSVTSIHPLKIKWASVLLWGF